MGWKAVVEILLIFAFLYWAARFLSGAGAVRGILLILLFTFVLAHVAARLLRLEVVEWLIDQATIPILIGALLVLQPEIRKAVVKIGHTPFWRRILRSRHPAVSEIAEAVRRLAARRIGALVAIEHGETLASVAESGTRLDAEVTRELLETIFWPGTPLHDLGTVIREGRAAAAGCLFPLSDRTGLPKEWGSRHRAALGLSEETDAVVVLVSEETGRIAIAHNGEIREPIDADRFEEALLAALDEPPAPKEPAAGPEPASAAPALDGAAAPAASGALPPGGAPDPAAAGPPVEEARRAG